MARSICEIEGCGKVVNGHGFCDKHSQRWAKYGSPYGGVRNHAPAPERFQRYVSRHGNNGCWKWTGKTEYNGYGRFQIGGKGSPFVGAHRFALSEKLGRPIQKGMVAMHSCDNPWCVNPDHLSEGTPAQNTWDMVKKGRNSYFIGYGENATSAKLTWEKVREIRSLDWTQKAMARHYSVSPSAIRAVLSGRTWKEA